MTATNVSFLSKIFVFITPHNDNCNIIMVNKIQNHGFERYFRIVLLLPIFSCSYRYANAIKL